MTKIKPINRQRPTQQYTVLLAADLKNSVLAELDAGNPNQIAYSPCGQQSAEHGVVTRLGFNGELQERQLGWYLLGNGYRAYNPALMRFHSPDSLSPFGAGGINPYAYCSNEPIGSTDPTGHKRITILAPSRSLPRTPANLPRAHADPAGNRDMLFARPTTRVVENSLETRPTDTISTPLASKQANPGMPLIENRPVTTPDTSAGLSNSDAVPAKPLRAAEAPALENQIDPWFQPMPRGKRKQPILVNHGPGHDPTTPQMLVVSIKRLREAL